MLAQTSNTTSGKVANETQTSLSNVTDGNVTSSTQEQTASDTSVEDATASHKEGNKQPADSEAPVKKQHRRKPRIIFHPEDECRRSSKPSDDDEDDIVTDKQDEISDPQNDKMANTEQELDSKEEKVDLPSSQEETSTSTPSDNPSASKSASDVVGSQFPDTYQNSEFRPYNPLSHTLEDKLFPRPYGPANFFDYPSWPDKTECLDVVENLSSWVKSSRMDIDMAKRGHE